MSEPYASDRALVARLLAGERRAFEAFFDGQAPRLYRFALSRLRGDADAAEEVVQATLVRAVPKLAGFRGEAALFTWLCAFCRREIQARARRLGRSPVEVELVEEVPEVRAALELLGTDRPDDPEERLLRGEVARRIQVLLDHLPDRYGDALEWKYVEGLTVREIAERLGVGPIAVQSLLGRARRSFRDACGALGAELGLEPAGGGVRYEERR